MTASRYTEEQIAFARPQAEGGTPVAAVCRQMGASESSFHVWTKKYGKRGDVPGDVTRCFHQPAAGPVRQE